MAAVVRVRALARLGEVLRSGLRFAGGVGVERRVNPAATGQDRTGLDRPEAAAGKEKELELLSVTQAWMWMDVWM